MTDPPPHDSDRLRRLGLTTGCMVVAGNMIGTGVFVAAGPLLSELRSAPAVLLAWIIGGVIALSGALCYAELGAMWPRNGGEYLILNRVYHPAIGFLSGWTSLVVGFSGPIAISALACGEYLQILVPGLPPRVTAVVLVLSCSALHVANVQVGSSVLNALTGGKLALIAVFTVLGLARCDFGAPRDSIPLADAVRSTAFPLSLLPVSFAYLGWNAAAYVAGEFRRPNRTLPWALILGTGLVTVLYVGLNLVFVYSAPIEELAGHSDVGFIAARRLFGESAGRLLAGLIALGLVSAVGVLVMTGPRIYEAMGHDYPALRWLSGRAQDGGPWAATGLQVAVSLGLLLTSTAGLLMNYVGFTLSVFTLLTVCGVFIERQRHPTTERPYRVWGYPFTPLLSAGLQIWMLFSAVCDAPVVAWSGCLTLASGWCVWRIIRPPPANPPTFAHQPEA